MLHRSMVKRVGGGGYSPEDVSATPQPVAAGVRIQLLLALVFFDGVSCGTFLHFYTFTPDGSQHVPADHVVVGPVRAVVPLSNTKHGDGTHQSKRQRGTAREAGQKCFYGSISPFLKVQHTV